MNYKRKGMGDYACTYCYRKYRKKENYDKHLSCCEFFYRSRSMHVDIIYEPIPSQRELYQLVKELAYECDKMKKKIEQLETNNRNTNKKQITEYLQDYVPETNAYQWAEQIDIQEKHLNTVFNNTIIEGMKQAISEHIFVNSPFCSFYQKNNTLYIYNNENEVDAPKWHAATNRELDKIISILSYKFLKTYLEWKQKNEYPLYHYEDDPDSKLSTSEQELEEKIAEDMKKQQLIYMMKINGNRTNSNCTSITRICDDVKRTEIKKTLYDLVQKKLPTFVEG